jgi:hypothetical protein
MKRGDKVYIRSNPHRKDAESLAGVVVAVRPGEGFGGADLVDVRYVDPWTGKEETMPFGTASLAPGSRDELLAAAERFERQAAMLRQMAEAQ